MKPQLTPDLSLILSNHRDWLRLVHTKKAPLTEQERQLRGDLSGLEIKDYRFSYLDLSYMTLERTHFEGCTFVQAALKGVWALDVHFDNCLMQETLLCNVYGKRADFTGSDLRGSDLSHSFWIEADFTDADLKGVKAVGGFFQGASFEDAKLDGTIDIQYARLDADGWKSIKRMTPGYLEIPDRG